MFGKFSSTFVKFLGKVLKIKVHSDGYIEFNGKRFYMLKTAVTHNVTNTSIPVNSFVFTTHATGRDKIFYSDGAKLQSITGS